MVISTDPAHNLSDAFAQKFSRTPTAVNGITNLFCMEIDPNAAKTAAETEALESDTTGIKSMIAELSSSIPGIDEAMSFAELMQQVQTMEYEVIVFDTAPTGHTLRLLSFPKVLEGAFDKLIDLKSKFGGLFTQMSSMFGAGMPKDADIMNGLDQIRGVIEKVHKQFKDPDRTTFVCVAIPEFLSVYETERLVQELAKYGIDVHNVVINQVLYPEEGSTCGKCNARKKMQQKYLDQVYDLYEDFHVVQMPLLDEEVRGFPKIERFSKFLLNPYKSGDDNHF